VEKLHFSGKFLGFMDDFSIDSVVEVAQNFFPFIDSTSFCDLFKLSPMQVAKHLQTNDFFTIRNFLLLLLWCRHYLPMRALGVLFNLKKTQISSIIQAETEKMYTQIRKFVNLDELQIFDPFFLNNCVGVVDSTELQINTWVGDSYSGKKGHHTLKYQVICCLTTGKPVQICGPYFGKESDATIWKKSGMGEYLQEDDLWVLGDKGYQGCLHVKHCLKKKPGQDTLDPSSREYNRQISVKRVEIENHFAKVKVWKAISHVYRGDLTNHVKIYYTCEILALISQS
jgi:hypothetical protein